MATIKFQDAVAGAKVGKSLFLPPPFSFPGMPRVKMQLTARHPDTDLCTFEVTWHGVYLGTVCGKATGSINGWRFDPTPRT